MKRFALIFTIAALSTSAMAQDADLERAYQACHGHIVWDPQHPSGRLGWQPGWEMCAQIEGAWTAARNAADEAAQRDIINKVLPKLQGKP